MTLAEIRRSLQALGNAADAARAQRFFKTGPGEYGEGDMFLGIRAQPMHALVRACGPVDDATLQALLDSAIHEHRLFALQVMVRDYRKAGEARQRALHALYLRNRRRVNNWDLVDCSAEHIAGAWLAKRSRARLHALAKSPNVWDRRIAIMSTFAFVKAGESRETLAIAKVLLDDEHDLIHKAVGWMLREVGKRASLADEEAFLAKHGARMPRTMLRYAIERFPEAKRRRYLALGTATRPRRPRRDP